MDLFGKYVGDIRRAKNVTLTDFAHQLGISPAYWSRIENNREKPPKDDLIKRAAELLEMSVDDLFIAAVRLPPDIQMDVGEAVRLYRKEFNNDEKK